MYVFNHSVFQIVFTPHENFVLSVIEADAEVKVKYIRGDYNRVRTKLMIHFIRHNLYLIRYANFIPESIFMTVYYCLPLEASQNFFFVCIWTLD